MSCTKAFTSRYGKGFGLFDTQSHFNIPNPVYGVIFYTTQLLICGFASSNLITNQIFMLLSLISNLLSLYLAYILFLLKTICIVCVALYTINFAMLIASIRRVNDIKKRKAKQE
ncbi:vitamin K epoxide reductase complex subunit 1-like protein 1 [Dinothrombium tinctorium]|uniref:vitamin-K-epoxide reductase (warfarin-sensitive) n=1 Tax=Dinothrombium tinctorium TaxID=1965070 RepID=A0A3S3PMH9_9ACAR|nr:vitamin K epoxide reductase complex subunit 1-like protein 1 [Dinothrombium tinctorium]RWS04529.1 vitamin K epoxide reductase complex subunit 1-like protein 1 [Dinothrombium tinctorium]